MHRSSNIYDELDKTVINIYLDYGFNKFPLDEANVCERLGIRLIPYSDFEGSDIAILKKRSLYGFYPSMSSHHAPAIFYNDTSDIKSKGCVRQTIFHELKHYVYNEQSDSMDEDDLAEHFGRYFLCPTPYLIVKDIVNAEEIVDTFNVSYTLATNVSKAVSRRMAYYGKKLFNYEKPLIQLLDPEYYYANIEQGGGCL